MLFTLSHFPCGATLLTIQKETQSLKWTWISFHTYSDKDHPNRQQKTDKLPIIYLHMNLSLYYIEYNLFHKMCKNDHIDTANGLSDA